MEERPTLEPIRAAERQVRHPRLAAGLTLAAAAIVAAVAQLGGGIAAGPVASPEPLPARIAVVWAHGAFSTIDDRGQSQVPHPVDGVGFQFPAWSPDGLHVAAVGTNAEGGGVYVIHARASTRDPPTTEPTVDAPEPRPLAVLPVLEPERWPGLRSLTYRARWARPARRYRPMETCSAYVGPVRCADATGTLSTPIGCSSTAVRAALTSFSVSIGDWTVRRSMGSDRVRRHLRSRGGLSRRWQYRA